MTVQSVASIARQGLAIVAIAMGVITQSVTALHLSPAESGILTVIGGVILAIEHYVSDPSTGTTTTPAAPVAVAKPVPVPTTVGNLGSPAEVPSALG